MNKYIYLLTVILGIYMASCSKQKQRDNSDNAASTGEPTMMLTARDTSQFLMLTSDFLSCLKNEHYDEAVSKLYSTAGDTLSHVDAERANELKALFKRTHGIRYEITSIQFHSDNDNLVNYTIILFDNEHGEHHPNTIKCALNPIRIGNQWYLSLIEGKPQQ